MNGKRLGVWGCFVMVLSMSGGCIFLGGDDDDNVPSCSSAISSFYDEGCVFTSGGEVISESDMIGECNEGDRDAPECGCVSEMDDLKICVDRVRDQDCNRCDNELTDMFACFDNC